LRDVEKESRGSSKLIDSISLCLLSGRIAFVSLTRFVF
jgi:hypothetical protein